MINCFKNYDDTDNYYGLDKVFYNEDESAEWNELYIRNSEIEQGINLYKYDMPFIPMFINPIRNTVTGSLSLILTLPFIIPTKMRAYRYETMKNFEIHTIALYVLPEQKTFQIYLKN